MLYIFQKYLTLLNYSSISAVISKVDNSVLKSLYKLLFLINEKKYFLFQNALLKSDK